MKFDMSRAWNEAVEMMRANREVLAIVAGLFFFVPAVIAALALPEVQQPPVGSSDDPEAVMDAMLAAYTDRWWVIALTSIIQMIGTIALLALLRDASRPTVGEAMKTGAVGFLPYLLAYLLLALGLGLAGAVLIGGLAAVSTALAALGGLIFAVMAVYAMVKFSLVEPVVAIDKVMNPFAVLKRSWAFTKGSSVKLFFFYLLLIVVYVVIAAILGAIFGLVSAALGTGAVSLGIQAILSGLLGAVAATVRVAVLAAVHRQLAGPSAERVSETFD